MKGFSLINPNQMRWNGTIVDDNPFAGPLSIAAGDFMAPMETNGVIIGFKTRTPTEEELLTCPHVVLTSDAAWDPHNVQLCASAKSFQKDDSQYYLHTGDLSHEPLVPGDTLFDKARINHPLNCKGPHQGYKWPCFS